MCAAGPQTGPSAVSSLVPVASLGTSSKQEQVTWGHETCLPCCALVWFGADASSGLSSQTCELEQGEVLALNSTGFSLELEGSASLRPMILCVADA